MQSYQQHRYLGDPKYRSRPTHQLGKFLRLFR